MIRVKICGVTTPDDVRMVGEAGADAIGLNFYPKSPRYVEPRAAIELMKAFPPFVAPVGVFVNTPTRQATVLAFQLGLRGLQTYTDQPLGEGVFPFVHLPAFRVKDAESLNAVTRFVEEATALGQRPAAVLIDSYVAGEMGGTGHKAPWHLLTGFDPGVPLILAGGLTPDNVAEAIQLVRPWGVDVASGVESSPGRKDAAKVRTFVKNARAAGSI